MRCPELRSNANTSGAPIQIERHNEDCPTTSYPMHPKIQHHLFPKPCSTIETASLQSIPPPTNVRNVSNGNLLGIPSIHASKHSQAIRERPYHNSGRIQNTAASQDLQLSINTQACTPCAPSSWQFLVVMVACSRQSRLVA